MNVRRPFAPQQPANTSSRGPFGAGWALLFVAFTGAATVLWTGIAESRLVQLQASMGPNTKFVWLAGIFAAAILVPALLPKGAAKLRGFQIWSLVLLALALGGAVFLRREALPDTAKAGTRAAIGLFAGAAIDDPKGTLADLLTGENYQIDLVPAVPPGYAESMTRPSAKATAQMLLTRHTTYVDLVLAVNADNPSGARLAALKSKLTALAAQLPAMDERAGLEAALGLQAEVTAELLVADKRDTTGAAKLARDAAARAKQAAASATCETRGEETFCTLSGVLYRFEREGGRWRVARPTGNDALLAIPFIPNVGLQPPSIAPNPKGDDASRALYTVDAVVRAGIRISKKKAIDPAVEALIADDAVPAQLELMESLMFLAASTSEYEAQRYAAALKAEQIADGTWLEFPTTAEVQAAVTQKRKQRSTCDARAQMKKAIARWNQVFPDLTPDARENTLVDALVHAFSMKRATPTEFTSARAEKIVLTNGVWQWWTPRAPQHACVASAPVPPTTAEAAAVPGPGSAR